MVAFFTLYDWVGTEDDEVGLSEFLALRDRKIKRGGADTTFWAGRLVVYDALS